MIYIEPFIDPLNMPWAAYVREDGVTHMVVLARKGATLLQETMAEFSSNLITSSAVLVIGDWKWESARNWGHSNQAWKHLRQNPQGPPGYKSLDWQIDSWSH